MKIQGRTATELLELNKKRLLTSVQDIVTLITKSQKEAMKTVEIYHNNKKIQLNQIDFNTDCLFLTDQDMLGIISYYGLLTINNIKLNDTSFSGEHSTVKQNYMIVSAADARQAMFAYDLSDIDPTSWKLENYLAKDLIIWNLSKTLGTGSDKDSTSITNSVKSTYEVRRFNNKHNWLFFTGTDQEFKNIFKLENIPNIYVIKTKKSTIKQKITDRLGDVF